MSNQVPPSENRYQLVNSVAKKAKVLISHDSSAQLSHHNAIREAMQHEDEPRENQTSAPSAFN